MNTRDAWVYLGGPEPALVREMLALVRAPAPASAPEVEAFSERVMEAIRTRLSGGAPVGVERDVIEGEEDDEVHDDEEEEGEAPAVAQGAPRASEATVAGVAGRGVVGAGVVGAGVVGAGLPRTALSVDVPPAAGQAAIQVRAGAGL
ncbi:MAG: hypothetical protein QM820_06380 [Minicystis sp.]